MKKRDIILLMSILLVVVIAIQVVLILDENVNYHWEIPVSVFGGLLLLAVIYLVVYNVKFGVSFRRI